MADKRKNRKPNRPAPRGTPEVEAYTLSPADKERLEGYWKRNIRLTLTLLAVWFIVGYVLAIIFAPALNTITFLGGPLGFWIAQNGAIYVFILLILIYCLSMNRLDEEFDVGDR